MPWIELSTPVTIAIDIAAWFVIHMGVAWLFTRQQTQATSFQNIITNRFFGETKKIYERVFLIKQWKSLLPDAAPWFKDGFPKQSLSSNESSYLSQFIIETRRGELSHWTCCAFSFLFFIWNPLWVSWLMVFVGVAFNLPCILVQRYNRLRLLSVIGR